MSIQDNQLVTRFKLLATREKVLIVLSASVVLLFLWFVFVHEPLLEERSSVQDRLSSVRTETESITAEVTALQVKAEENPNAAANAELKRLRREELKLDATIRRYTDQLVTPRQMVTILREMLVKQPGLTLLSLKNLPPEVLFDSAAEAAKAEAAKAEAEESGEPEEIEEEVVDTGLKLYRHVVRIELKGDFFSTVAYLKLMEELQKKVLWNSLDYNVIIHPEAKITIELFTLSFQRGVIGV